MDDFLTARDAYINGEYAVAARALRVLADRDLPEPRAAPIVTSARKYYAACLFAQGQEPEARAVLSRMLRDDPDARLDQVQFEAGFHRLFENVLRELQPELEQIRARRVLERQRAETARAARREAAMRIFTTEQRVSTVPRALTLLPFGVGQFINGQRGLGVFFLVTEVALVAGSVATWAVHTSLYPNDPLLGPGVFIENSDRGDLSEAMRISNYVSLGLLGGTMIVGVALAFFAWQPYRPIGTVPRPLPRELEGVQISLGAGGITLAF